MRHSHHLTQPEAADAMGRVLSGLLVLLIAWLAIGLGGPAALHAALPAVSFPDALVGPWVVVSLAFSLGVAYRVARPLDAYFWAALATFILMAIAFSAVLDRDD